MKAFIVLAAVVALAAAKTIVPLSDDQEKTFKECQASTHATDAIAHKVRAHELDFDDKNGKCLIKCICEKAGFCDSDLKVITSKWEKVETIPKAKLDKANADCNILKGADDCDTSFLRFQCILNIVPEIPAHA